jgi:hypothetical protein
MPDLGHLVSCADSLKLIEQDWVWISLYLMADLKSLDDPNEKATFAIAKIHSLVASTDLDSDEKSHDSKFRAAARSWRQLFPTTSAAERLVSFYSCAYHKKISNQGIIVLRVDCKDGCTRQ